MASSAALALLAASCADHSGPRKITQTRATTITPDTYQLHATNAQRFHDPFTARPDEPAGASASELVWDVPPGWIEQPPTDMRYANLQPLGNPDAECYVSKLPARAEVIPSNVNRWRKQFGLPELDDAACAALPKQLLLGLDATRVEAEGEFHGAGDAPVKSGFALIGLIARIGTQALFVKMTGPKELVDHERSHFDEFVKSLRLEKSGASEGTKQRFDPTALKFKLPDGWTREADRPMRIATLKPGRACTGECAITSFPGDTGGLFENVKRWRGQMGLPAPTTAEVAALPKIKVLERDATLVELDGSFADANNQRTVDHARFLGVIVLLGDASVFVKLTGPASEIDDQVRAQFLELCQSFAVQ